MSDWTKEPWHLDEYRSVLSGREAVVLSGVSISCGPRNPLAERNTERIVACVNALAGIADPAAELTRLRSELAGMREALEWIARTPQCGCKPCTGQCISPEALALAFEDAQDTARAALAKHGGQP